MAEYSLTEAYNLFLSLSLSLALSLSLSLSKQTKYWRIWKIGGVVFEMVVGLLSSLPDWSLR